jgi:hypothetical protein
MYARLTFYFLLAILGSSVRLSVQAQIPDLFPESPRLAPDEKAPSRESPFLEDIEPLNPLQANDVMTSGSALNHLFSHQWVQTNGTGSLKGSVVTLAGQDTLSVSGMRVTLSQRGRVVATTTSNQNGDFLLPNVAPGCYSIIAEADNSFATFGLAVLSKESGAHLPDWVELRVIRPKGEAIRRILGVDLSPTQASGTWDGYIRDPLTKTRTYAKSHRILSTEDGRVKGRLSVMGMTQSNIDMSQMKAMLLKDGNERSRVEVARDGSFQFNGVEPGCYGLLAVGNRGVAAVAFCVIKPSSVASNRTADGKFLVSMAVDTLQDTASDSLNVELADGNDVMMTQQETTEEEAADKEAGFVPPPIARQLGGGQIIGGGGGGGFGGLLGGLAELGALGAVAAILANEFDNNNNNNVNSPITQ